MESMLPPRFWEIGKRIKEHKKQQAEEQEIKESNRKQFAEFFAKYNVTAQELNARTLRKYKAEWVRRFAPKGANMLKLRRLCVRQREYSSYLWYLFSYEYVTCDEGAKADATFDAVQKSDCVLVESWSGLAYCLTNAEKLTAPAIAELDDAVITASDFAWTYAVTHERDAGIGPYFYRKES